MSPQPAVSLPWSAARRILCVRLDAMGDVLMTTPALRALKQSIPGCSLALLTSPSGAEVAALAPEVDRVMVYDAPWMKATAKHQDAGRDWDMIATLGATAFDAAVIFTVYSQNPLPTALLCYLADVPLRLAYCHENPYQLLTHWVADPEPAKLVRHEVQRQLDLVGAIGCYADDDRLSLALRPEDMVNVNRLLRNCGIDLDQPWAVLHPGASAPSRTYPPEQFAATARLLAEEEGWQLVFTGSASEGQLIEMVRASLRGPNLSLAGRLSLGELAALIASAPLLISNNTGPVHLAAAVGTPVVDLYALINPQHTPWRVPHRLLYHDVPCKYCYKSTCPLGHHDCLRLVSPQQVYRAALELYQETVGTPRQRKTALAGSIGFPPIRGQS